MERISRTKNEIIQEAQKHDWVHGDMVSIPCDKCDGTGKLPWYIHVLEGVCFRCGGSGVYFECLIDKYVKREQSRDRRDHHRSVAWKVESEARHKAKRERLQCPDFRIVELIDAMDIVWNNIVDYGTVPKISGDSISSKSNTAWNLISQWVESGTLTELQWTLVKTLIDKVKNPLPVSEYQGQIKERLTVNVTVKFLHCFEVEDRYNYNGMSWKTIVKFVDDKGNVYTWFTGAAVDVAREDQVILTGIVKKHGEYKGEKQTVLIRCKMKEVG